MTPFIKVTPAQAQDIIARNPPVWWELPTANITPALVRLINYERITRKCQNSVLNVSSGVTVESAFAAKVLDE